MFKLPNCPLTLTSLLLILIGLDSAAQTSVSLQALVRAVSGNATVTFVGQPPQPVRAGSRYPTGARIETGPGAVVDLFLGRGGGVLRLRESSSMVLESLEISDTGSGQVAETGIRLLSGELLGIANRQSPGSSFEISTGEGLVGVRGARYRVQALGFIQVLDGQLVYVTDGKANVIQGPGEFNSSQAVPLRVLTPPEIPPLAALFRGMDGTAGTVQQQLRPPPPNLIPLSPITGG